MKTFNLKAWNNKTNEFQDCEFICKKSKVKHKKLKDFSSGDIYWFEGLTGQNWYRGGFYKWDNGFINANVNKDLNVQGVVFENEVYILKKVVVKS